MPWKAVRSASPAVVSWPRYRCGAGAAAAPAESGIPPPAPAKENPRPLNRRMTKKISNPMISTVSNPPNTWPRPPMPPPRLLNSIEPRKPPASPLMNGWRWKKLPPIAPAPAPAPASGLVADGVWVMLRESGAAPLLSKVRVPRLPMLEPPPLEELPARASARLGASASVRQKNSGSRMRHCTMCPSRGCAADRLDMIISPSARLRTPWCLNIGRRRGGKRQIDSAGAPAVAFRGDAVTRGRLTGGCGVPKSTIEFVLALPGAALGPAADLARGAVQLAVALGVRAFRASARPGQQDLRRRLSALQRRATRRKRVAHHPRGRRLHDGRSEHYDRGQPAGDPRQTSRRCPARLSAPRDRGASVSALFRPRRGHRGARRVARERAAPCRSGAADGRGEGAHGSDPRTRARRRHRQAAPVACAVIG